jgi:hypothetical protein
LEKRVAFPFHIRFLTSQSGRWMVGGARSAFLNISVDLESTLWLRLDVREATNVDKTFFQQLEAT